MARARRPGHHGLIMKKQVLCFVYSPKATTLLLIEKKRGAGQQMGWCNAVGGTIEEGESFRQAGTRETKEETNVVVPEDAWVKFYERIYSEEHTRIGEKVKVEFLAAYVPFEEFWKYQSRTDERVLPVAIANLLDPRYPAKIYPDLKFLVHMSKYYLEYLNARPDYAEN